MVKVSSECWKWVVNADLQLWMLMGSSVWWFVAVNVDGISECWKEVENGDT